MPGMPANQMVMAGTPQQPGVGARPQLTPEQAALAQQRPGMPMASSPAVMVRQPGMVQQAPVQGGQVVGGAPRVRANSLLVCNPWDLR